jgi:hypothetical protein
MAAGKTKISGTTYNILGGKTKINGTTYNILGGKTKVSGTTYNITFSKTLTIAGTDGDYSSVRVNGVDTPDGIYTFDNNTTIQVWVYATNSSYASSCKVYLNNNSVKSGEGSYTLSNVSSYNTIKIKYTKVANGYYLCYITTT